MPAWRLPVTDELCAPPNAGAALTESTKLTPRRLEILPVENFPWVRAGDNLAELALTCLQEMDLSLQADDILVVAQKIISKSEGQLARLDAIEPSDEALELAAEIDKDARLVQLILDESRNVMRRRPGLVIVQHRLGLVHANAGIDQSNLEGNQGSEEALLLPQDPDASARSLRKEFKRLCGTAPGVIISDSMGRAWRLGTVCQAIGSSGVVTLEDRRGETDLSGRVLEHTVIATADQLAAAAGLVMGEASEGRPIVLIRGLAAGDEKASAQDLLRPLEEDMFR